MEQLYLPELHCPFPSAISRYAEQVDRRTLAWAREFDLLTTSEAYRRLDATRVGWLVGRAHPEASFEQLQLLADFTTWLFVQDDQCDELGIGKQPKHLRAMHLRALQTLEGIPPTATDRPLIQALRQLYLRLTEISNPEWMSRFVQSCRDSLNGSIWEAENRAHAVVPDIKTYIEKRRFTGGMYPYVALFEITGGVALTPSVQGHATIEAITRCAINVVCWANDLLSLGKEMQHGDVHNLVIVLHHQYGLTWQEAYNRAAVLHNAEVRAFVALEQRLGTSDCMVTGDLKRYLAMLRSWMRGNLDWSYTSGRYLQTTIVPVERQAMTV
ncbi:MAG: hypothetical protein NVS4B8_05370 [Herpetosiphon sp.]